MCHLSLLPWALRIVWSFYNVLCHKEIVGYSVSFVLLWITCWMSKFLLIWCLHDENCDFYKAPIIVMGIVLIIVVTTSSLQFDVINFCLGFYSMSTVFQFFNPFPHNDTFWHPWETSLLKTLWEKEKLLVTSSCSFPTMFSTVSKTEIIIFVSFDLSSANAFDLDQSKMLSSGNGLMATGHKSMFSGLLLTSPLSWQW